MNSHSLLARNLRRLSAIVLLAAFASPASAGLFKQPPKWVGELRSMAALCTTAAEQARNKALDSGIAPSRMQWLYGRKPFNDVGHVSLVIDGWIVVDNGGLGRNAWGDAICPDNICTLKEARRGYEESFLEDASVALRQEVALGEWRGLVASRD
jgi:hypothetical protein